MNNIEKAIILKQELDTYRPLKKEDEIRIMQKFKLDWNYHSNNLEGNSLTFGETKALILHNITAHGKPLKDHLEITGHNEAIELIIDVVKDNRPLTESFIRSIHELILKEPYDVNAITPDGEPTKKRITIGQYKTTPNHVKTSTGEMFYFAKPEETPAKMNDLIQWLRTEKEKPDVNPILLAAQFHYRFIIIHPFDDGNGRTVRILMNFILMQYGYPPAIITTDDKENYYRVLRIADGGNLEPFIEYIANSLVQSLEIMIKGAKGESIEEPDDILKEVALLEQRLKGLSETIEEHKTQENIRYFYTINISEIAKSMLRKGKAFSRFYVKDYLNIGINGSLNKIEPPEVANIDSYVENVYNHDNIISLIYRYEAFRQTGFNEFYYSSKIEFQFDITRIRILDSKGNLIMKKLYSDILSSDEIDLIVNAEIKLHKEYIEKEIKNFEKSKKSK